jgi:hypothetical protein
MVRNKYSRWRVNLLVLVRLAGSTLTYAWGINTAGTLALGWIDAAGYSEASLDNGSTYTSINLPGTYNMAVHSYYLLDDPNGTGTRADSIDDSGLDCGPVYSSSPGSRPSLGRALALCLQHRSARCASGRGPRLPMPTAEAMGAGRGCRG